MITCTLGEKKYSVDYVTGRALREMEPAAKMYGRIVRIAQTASNGDVIAEEDKISIPDALDVMVHWFCILFGNKFTPDDVYDNYPNDRLVHDLALALLAVQSQTTDVLDSFPTKPTTK